MGVLLTISVGKYKVVVEGGSTWLDIRAISPDGRERSINNLNYVLSEVIQPVIEDWEDREDIVEGVVVSGTPKEIKRVLKRLKSLEGDKSFEKALKEDFSDGGL